MTSEAGRTISVALKGARGAFALDVDFQFPARGVTALYGPSGSGKTTVLRCLAGLDRMSGRLIVGDDVWQDTAHDVFLAPHRRQIGYVFQEASLFTHLSVRDNLTYGAKRVASGVTGAFEFASIVEMLGIAALLDRRTQDLSGGERQRVAVGRALLSAPRLLLMDEPLSALDRPARDDILPYLELLHERLSLPVLYVSHDLAEVQRLADTLVLMEHGRIVATGNLREMQIDPHLPLLRGPGATVALDAVVVRHDRAFVLTVLSVPGGELIVPGLHGSLRDRRRLQIAAADVSLALTAPADSTILNCLPARIVSVAGYGDAPHANVVLALGNDGRGSRFAARITRKSLTTLGLGPGAAVFAQIKSVALTASRAGAVSSD